MLCEISTKIEILHPADSFSGFGFTAQNTLHTMHYAWYTGFAQTFYFFRCVKVGKAYKYRFSDKRASFWLLVSQKQKYSCVLCGLHFHSVRCDHYYMDICASPAIYLSCHIPMLRQGNSLLWCKVYLRARRHEHRTAIGFCTLRKSLIL